MTRASNIPEYLPSIGRSLGFVTASVNALSDHRLAEHGLTRPQWVVLTALWRQDRMSESELVTYCRSSPSAINRLVDRMAKRGFVRRAADPDDGRRVIVELAETGRELDGLLEFYTEINELILDGFSQDEVETFVALLERVGENAQKALEGERSG